MIDYETSSEHDLLRLMMTGDEEAFSQLYRRLRGKVYRFARQMSGSTAVAEDVTQEVFLILIRKAGLYDPGRGALSSYLYRITRNEVFRRLDRERPFVRMTDIDDTEEDLYEGQWAGNNDPLGEMTRNEDIESVRRAILGLPLHYREVVVLCELEEMSYTEASTVLGCSIGTIRSRLHRARGLLLQKLRASSRIESESERPDRANYGS